MCLLFESIKVVNAVVHNREFHEARIRRAQQTLFGKTSASIIDKVKFPLNLESNTVYKLRITYDTKIRESHFSQYYPRKISSLHCVADNQIEYPYKYEDRNRIQTLLRQKGDADDIIITKNGRITDSSYTNLAFLRNGKWYTPDTPLLPGTKRAVYLEQGNLEETRITLENLRSFEGVCLINAFLDLDEDRLIPIEKIKMPDSD